MKMQKKTHLKTQTQVDFVAPSTLRGTDVFLRAAIASKAQGRNGEGVFVDAPMTKTSTYAEHFPPGTIPYPKPPYLKIPEVAAVSSLPLQSKSHYRESFAGTQTAQHTLDAEESTAKQGHLHVSHIPFKAVTTHELEFQYRWPSERVKSCKPDHKLRIQHYPQAMTTEYGKTYGYLGRQKRGRTRKYAQATEAAPVT
jgi:hypothetical protein